MFGTDLAYEFWISIVDTRPSTAVKFMSICRNPRLSILCIVLAISAAVSWPFAYAQAAVFTFNLIADSNTAIPDGTGGFTALSTASISDGNAVFLGTDAAGTRGIYSYMNGALGAVADIHTTVPGGGDTFRYLVAPTISGTSVAFRGMTVDSTGNITNQGIYVSTGGTVSTIADWSTTAPNSSGLHFGDIQSVAISGSNIIFGGGYDPSTDNLYSSNNGVLGVVADPTTPVPGGTGTFLDIGYTGCCGPTFTFTPTFDIDGDNIVFLGVNQDGSSNGVYTSINGSLSLVADLNSAVPGGAGNFCGLGLYAARSPSIDGANISFFGFGQPTSYCGDNQGIYSSINGSLDLVADTGMARPDAAGVFSQFGQATSIDGDTIAFIGDGGLYLDAAGFLEKVAAPGELLDGKTIASIDITNRSLDNGELIFTAHFDDGSYGVYTTTLDASVSEPASVAIFCIAFLGLVRMRRCRQFGSITAT